jgi:hypothetical protein
MSYTLPPKYQRYADRLHELIEEGKKLYTALDAEFSVRTQNDWIAMIGWFAKTENILVSVFGKNNVHHQHYQKGREYDFNSSQIGTIPNIIGVLQAGLNDLENGFLLNQEFLVASDVFDSVLEQAKHLLRAGYKDPAAVLCRVVLEDSLKRLARANGLDDTKKAALINQDLKQANFYNQPQWRQIDAWLDTGNKAAHGDFNTYNDDDVKRMNEGIEAFLASYLSIT